MPLRRIACPGPGREVYCAYGSGGTDRKLKRVAHIAENWPWSSLRWWLWPADKQPPRAEPRGRPKKSKAKHKK